MSSEFTAEELEQAIKNLATFVKRKPDEADFAHFKGRIGYAEFKEMPNPKGIYGFINGESCAACTAYLKSLKTLGNLKGEITLVELNAREMDRVKAEDSVSVPFTRIYNGEREPIWEVQGVLYSTQLESLFRAYKRLDTRETQHSMDEFDIFSAKQKPVPVQVFKAKSFLNLSILGKKIIARPGDFVIYFREEGNFEVLDEGAFNHRFEV